MTDDDSAARDEDEKVTVDGATEDALPSLVGDDPRSTGGLPDLGVGGMDMGSLLASAQEAMSAQAEAAEATVEGSAGGGMVRVTMSGAGEVTRVRLEPEVVDPEDVEMLQDLIVAAVRDAATQVAALHREALGALGQIDLGNLGGGLGRLLGGREPEQ